MGRKKLLPEEKKQDLTIYLPKELSDKLEQLDIKNKSKFFNWLLEEHFNELENGRK